MNSYNDIVIKKTKRRWLEAAMILCIWGTLQYAFSFMLTQGVSFTVSNILSYVGIGSIAYIIPFLIVYYCAYRKPGTALLSVQLYIGPWVMLGRCIQDLKDFIPNMKLFYSVNKLMFCALLAWLLLTIFSYIYYLYRVSRLRKVNLKINDEQATLALFNSEEQEKFNHKDFISDL